MMVSATAKLRFVSIPPRKMRLVANQIKGLPVQKALDLLNFTPKIAARHVAKTLKSAAANALSQEGTDRLHPEDLTVKSIWVDDAPTAKRIRFRSMGRVYRYRKRFCHLTVLLEGEMRTEEKPARKPTKRATKAKAEDEGESKPTGKATRKPAKKSGAKAAAKKTGTKKAAAKKAAPKKTEEISAKAAADKTDETKAEPEKTATKDEPKPKASKSTKAKKDPEDSDKKTESDK
jgi:large subunit ribosomal protein L22